MTDFFTRFVLQHRELAEEMLQAGEFSATEAHEVELVFLKNYGINANGESEYGEAISRSH